MTATALTIQPARAVRGGLRVPGDKSISHRAVLFGAIARGTTSITGLSGGADVASTVACMRALGVDIRDRGPGTIDVQGLGRAGLASPAGLLDAGNSGTTFRLLSGILAGVPFRSAMTGDASLRRRPMQRIIEPLTAMGARISSANGRAPLQFDAAALAGITWASPVASAQIKSCLLLAGLGATGRTAVREPQPSRDHTERLLPMFDIDLSRTDEEVAVEGGQELRAPSAPLDVPGDPSSAAVWAAAAAALPGSAVRITGVGLNPLRIGFARALERMGAHVTIEQDTTGPGEPVGTLTVTSGDLRPARIDADEVPGLIDELPVLAAAASLGGALEVSGAGELRVKESDRITALIAGLRALGVEAEERPDGFVIDGRRQPTGGTVQAHDDHRLVMAFAVVGLGASGPTRIEGADVVGVSYPGFAADLAALTGR